MVTIYLAMERGLIVVRGDHPNWQATHRLVGLQTTCVAVDPFQPQRVYCGTFGRGLWRSEDAGNSWEPIGDAGEAMEPWDGTGIVQPKITSIAVSPTEQLGGHGIVYAGTEPSTLYRSDDGGETWHELANLLALPSASSWSFPPRPYTSHTRWITCDPRVPGRLFVALEAGALVHSGDGGHTWEDRRPGGPFDSHTVAMHAQVPDRLYSAAGDGYFESRDGGASWQRLDDRLPYRYLWGLAVDPADADTILVSASPNAGYAHHQRTNAQAGIYRKTRSEPWQKVSQGLPPDDGTVIPVLASHQSEPGVFYALTNRGIFRSGDSGLTWEQISIPWNPAWIDQHQQAVAIGDA